MARIIRKIEYMTKVNLLLDHLLFWIILEIPTEISEPLLRIDTAANLPRTPSSSSAETRLCGLAMASIGPRWADTIE